MTIPIVLGLIILHVILGQAKFAMQRDPEYRERLRRREEIRERHAFYRRMRANKAKKASEGTQEDAANSSCCA